MTLAPPDSRDGLGIYRSGKMLTKGSVPTPIVPAVLMIDPKYPHNVGQAVRVASCYGVEQVWFTGRRVDLVPTDSYRLPREERMRGYQDVTCVHYDWPFDAFENSYPTFVAVEVRENAESLEWFEHPKNAVYVFGPEDGSLGRPTLQHCQRFIVIPTRHCLNLATAVGTVLYDREAKKRRGEMYCAL